MTEHPSAADWLAVLDREEMVDLNRIKTDLTNHPAIVEWMPAASYEAAEQSGGFDDPARAISAYGTLLDNLSEEFPGLLEAVRILTGGWGRLSIHWRPVSPQFSTLHIDFSLGYEPLYLIPATAREVEADTLIRQLIGRLPAGVPFRGRPDEAAGVITRNDRCLGVRVMSEYAGEGKARRYVSIDVRDGKSIEKIALADAESRIREIIAVD